MTVSGIIAPTKEIVFTRLLSPHRVRAQAIVLASCLWAVCAVDFATPGLFDRVGNIKFQDFLPIYVSARLIAQHHASGLYDANVIDREMSAIIHASTRVRITYLYGPQVGLFFVPLSGLSFPTAAGIWVTLSAILYFVCVYLVWKRCPNLRAYPGLVAVVALAFAPAFHFFVRGQLSALILVCFTVAFLALHYERPWVGGIAFGFLLLKPPFLAAIPLILVFAGTWKIFGGLVLSGVAQLAFTHLYFGAGVMRSYLQVLLHPSRWLNVAELSLAPIQMHSLRSFWTLVIPSASIALAAYALSSIAIIGLTVAIWKSSSSLALRFSALVFAAILVNPHLFVYDLLVMAPALLLLVDWTLANPESRLAPTLQLLAYLAFVLPLLGPLSRWTHVQLSVPTFVSLLITLYRQTRLTKLAPTESAVI